MTQKFSHILIAMAAGLLLTCPIVANAHVHFENEQVIAGKTFTSVLVVPHGCGNLPTKSVAIKIPEELILKAAVLKSGWTVKTKYGASGNVTLITYSGGAIPNGENGSFTLSGKLADAATGGAHIYVPVVQHCDGAKQRWIEVPKSDSGNEPLDFPAPTLLVEK